MEHIRQFDWCSSQSDPRNFVLEEDLDKNCVTEKILRNKFYDPLMQSSDSEDEIKQPKIDWNAIFESRKNEEKLYKRIIPGMRRVPNFPRLSSLTAKQHYQCLKVICAENPGILPTEFIPRPTKSDHKAYEEVQEQYLKEQAEFKEWARTMWSTEHCIRALRPKPTIDIVYESEFNVKANILSSFPKTFGFVAQIPLASKNSDCQMIFEMDILSINTAKLPHIENPEIDARKFSILKPLKPLEPCPKHPTRFSLPTEKTMSELPLTEIHRELANYALDHGANYIASENALKCLLEHDRPWILPVSVCGVINADGNKTNVLVLGSEFAIQKESPTIRTYRAFRHLLLKAFLPNTDEVKSLEEKGDDSSADMSAETLDQFNGDENMDVSNENGNISNGNGNMSNGSGNLSNGNCDVDSSSDDDNELFIDIDDDVPLNSLIDKNTSDAESENQKKQRIADDKKIDNRKSKSNDKEEVAANELKENGKTNNVEKINVINIGSYKCTCNNLVGKPPPRSFRRWCLKSDGHKKGYNIIVHCSHKVRGEHGEVILEPIPEYQIDLGGSKQSDHRINSLALSLALRKNASLINVRVDPVTGELVTLESMSPQELNSRHKQALPEAANNLHTALHQLQGLMPGHYLLQHESSHGANGMLLATRPDVPPTPHSTPSSDRLVLQFKTDATAPDDAKQLKTAPEIIPVLLPVHKHRKILPCAFTPFENQVAREPKKPVSKQKTPPQAIKWPKRRLRKRRNNILNNN